MLHFVLPSSFSLFTIFQISSTVFPFFSFSTVGSSLTFNVLFLLFCYFNILFLFMALCLFIANSVYYANKLIKYWNWRNFKILAYKSWFCKFFFEKKVRHKIYHIFDDEAENKILEFWKYRLSAHEWPIYQYRPQTSHIGRFLLLPTSLVFHLKLLFLLALMTNMPCNLLWLNSDKGQVVIKTTKPSATQNTIAVHVIIALTSKDWWHLIISSQTMHLGGIIFAKRRASLLAEHYFVSKH